MKSSSNRSASEPSSTFDLPDGSDRKVELQFHDKNWTPALDLLIRAGRHGWNHPAILILKGRCPFKLSEHDRALEAFVEADQLASDSETRLWIMKCHARKSPGDPLVFEPRPAPERRSGSW
jgi:hypothetical protein